MKILQPPNWPRPSGYSNGVRAEGEFVFVAGQVGWNEQQEFVSDTLVEQTRRALRNIVEVLREGGTTSDRLVRMNWYIADRESYVHSRKEIGDVYREVIGDHYPAMSLLAVNGLFTEEALVEIEATAVV